MVPPVDLPIGITQAGHEQRGIWLLVHATGRRPLHDRDEHKAVLEHCGFNPAEFELYPPFLFNPIPGLGYRTCWYAIRHSGKKEELDGTD